MFNNYWYNQNPFMRGYRTPDMGDVGQMMYYNGQSDYILDCKDGDVNGDRVPDSVCTVGHRPDDLQSPFVEDIAILIQDGATHKYTRIPLPENVGYNPTVFLADFTGNGVNEILVNIDSGGSGGFSYDYVYSFLNNQPKLLFDSEAFSNTQSFEVNYMNYYKVEVLSLSENKKFIIDISDKGSEYLDEIYNPDGTLKAPLQGEVIPLGNVYPVDYQRDGKYDLSVMQRIIGQYNADTLGIVETTLEWNDNEFVPLTQYVTIFGSEINNSES